MKITHHDHEHTTVMTLQGELAGSESDRFRRAVDDRLQQRMRDFVLDLAPLEAIDSEGLETLIWLQDCCAESLGQMRLAQCSPSIEQVLELTRLASRFDRHTTVEEAIASLG